MSSWILIGIILILAGVATYYDRKNAKQFIEMNEQEHFLDLGWREVKRPKVRVFQRKNEPKLIYVIKVRENKFMVIHEDTYGVNTGKIEHLQGYELAIDYGIFPEDHF